MAGRSGRFLVYRSYWPVNVRVNYRSGLQVASLQACVCRANEQHIGVFDGSIFCFFVRAWQNNGSESSREISPRKRNSVRRNVRNGKKGLYDTLRHDHEFARYTNAFGETE